LDSVLAPWLLSNLSDLQQHGKTDNGAETPEEQPNYPGPLLAGSVIQI
jgi:hypothetical protein